MGKGASLLGCGGGCVELFVLSHQEWNSRHSSVLGNSAWLPTFTDSSHQGHQQPRWCQTQTVFPVTVFDTVTLPWALLAVAFQIFPTSPIIFF